MKRTVLVIDDDGDILQMIKAMLDDAGYDVISVGDARHGLSKLESRPVDLVITDIIMPEMEGIEFIMKLKENIPSMPIIAISGGGQLHSADFLSFAQKLGASAVLAKPFRREKLLATVSKLLSTP